MPSYDNKSMTKAKVWLYRDRNEYVIWLGQTKVCTMNSNDNSLKDCWKWLEDNYSSEELNYPVPEMVIDPRTNRIVIKSILDCYGIVGKPLYEK